MRNYRGHGHALAGLDVGQKGGAAGAAVGDGSETSEERPGEGLGSYGVAGADSGELGEDLRAVDALLFERLAQGAGATHGDHKSGSLREEGLVFRRALQGAPAGSVGLHERDSVLKGKGWNPRWLDATDPVLGEDGARDDGGSFYREGFRGLCA